MSKLEELLVDYMRLRNGEGDSNGGCRDKLVADVRAEHARLVLGCQTAYEGICGARPRPTFSVVERDLKRALAIAKG